jgi:hypothetical protein
MSTSMLKSILLPIAVIALSFLHDSGAVGQSDDGIDPVLAAAAKRRDAVKTLAVKIRMTEVIPVGAIYDGHQSSRPAPVPAEETTLESIDFLVIDGDKLRYEDNHPHLLESGRLISSLRIYLFDGSMPIQFFPAGSSGTGDAEVLIAKNVSELRIASHVTTPITMAFPGLLPEAYSYNFADFKPADNKLTIDGASCQEYLTDRQGNSRFGDQPNSLWLDPANGYLVRRIRSYRQGNPPDQLDIHYRQSEGFGLVLDFWEYRRPLLRDYAACKIEILGMRINEVQSAEQFEMRFPPGAHVYDQRDGKNYLVQPDGSLRESILGEKDRPESEPQVDESFPSIAKWLLICLGVITVSAVGHFATMRKAKRIR